MSNRLMQTASRRLAYPTSRGAALLVNNMIYEGWTRVEVTRSLKEMAGSFALAVAERWTPGEGRPAVALQARIKALDNCKILYDGVNVMTGFIDAYNPHYTGTQHDVTVQGRSLTGDLCDSSAMIDGGELNNISFEQIVRTSIAPFGIGLDVDANLVEHFDRASVYPGETVQEFAERYARVEGVHLTDGADGKLRLVQVQPGAAVATLVEGVDILEGSAVIRGDLKHSEYHVQGQDAGAKDKVSGREAAGVNASARDASVKRHRPLMLLNESRTGKKAAKARGAAEKMARKGESTRAELKVVDWFRAPGVLWMPGDRVHVVSPMLTLDRILVIESTTMTIEEQGGTVTRMSLIPVEAANPQGASGATNKGDTYFGPELPEAWSEGSP